MEREQILQQIYQSLDNISRKMIKSNISDDQLGEVYTGFENLIKDFLDRDEEQLKERIRKKMIEEIRNNLTTGKSDEDLEPYNEKQIEEFLETNEEKLNKCVNEMYEDIKDDDFEKIEDDCFREFLGEIFDEVVLI